MKRLFTIIFLSIGLQCLAQQEYKTLEHNIQLGTGLSWADDDTERTGAAFSVGYGLGIRINEQFSIMPMVEYRQTSESIIRSSWDGISLNDFSFVDFSISGRYHLHAGKVPLIIGLAPYVSIVTDRDKYYVDYDPKSPLNGQPKLKKMDVGIMPTVSFDLTKHFSVGAKMNFSVINTSERYDAIDCQEARHIKSAEAFIRVRL